MSGFISKKDAVCDLELVVVDVFSLFSAVTAIKIDGVKFPGYFFLS